MDSFHTISISGPKITSVIHVVYIIAHFSYSHNHHQLENMFMVRLWNNDTDGLVQDCSNSIANPMELLQSCTKLSIYAVCSVMSLYMCDITTLDRPETPRKMSRWLQSSQPRTHSRTGLTVTRYLRTEIRFEPHYFKPHTTPWNMKQTVWQYGQKKLAAAEETPFLNGYMYPIQQ